MGWRFVFFYLLTLGLALSSAACSESSVPAAPGVTTTRTTTVTLETATENATIYYVEDGISLTGFGSAKIIDGSSGELRIVLPSTNGLSWKLSRMY